MEHEQAVDAGPVTVEEQYARAVLAGRLKSDDGPGATDVLMAMACEGGLLGPLLYRVRVEYDTVKAQHAHAQREHRQLQEAIKRASTALKRAMSRGPSLIARDLAELQAQADMYAQLDHAMILDRMHTLPSARTALGRWAESEANRYLARAIKPHPTKLMGLRAKALTDTRPGPSPWYFELWRLEQARQRALVSAAQNTTLTPAAVRALAGGVLRAFIDSTCRACGGRGHRCGDAVPEVACRACGGTGLAQASLGQCEEQREFARYLLAEVERMFDAVNRRMQRYLRGRNLRG